MKKIFKVILALFFAIFITGCGEESSNTNTVGVLLSIETQKSKLDNLENKIDIDFLLKSNYNTDVEVTLDSLNLNVDPCSVKSVKFTPNKIILNSKGKEKQVHAVVAFKDSCTPSSYRLKANTLLNFDGQNNKVIFTSSNIEINSTVKIDSTTTVTGVSSDSNSSPDSNVSSVEEKEYFFYNFPKEIIIEEANKEYSFRVQLLDKENTVVVGRSISISGYNVKFGELESYSALTDAKGFATFSFTSAKSLKDLFNKTLSLKLKYSTVKEDAIINLKFKEYDILLRNDYYLLNPSHISVEVPNVEQNIFVDLVDKEGIGIPSKEIKIATINSKYGSFISSTAITDNSGKATFIYKSPLDIVSIDKEKVNVSLNFTENNTLFKTIATLTFNGSSYGNQKNNYHLINATNLIIDTVSKEKTISVNLVDNRGVAVENKEIKITTPNNLFGSIVNSKAITDESGKATFIYKTPIDIASIDGKSTDVILSFREDGITISTLVTITILKKSAIDYHLINPKDIIVDLPKVAQSIEIDLVDNQNNPVSGKDIKMSALDREYGTILNPVVKTDAKGRATFNYTSADDLTPINGTHRDLNITFIEDGVTISQMVTITILKKSAIDYHLINPKDIIVDLPKVAQSIEIDLVDNQNNPVSGKDIKMSALDREYGTILNPVVKTDAKGRATFNYTSADDLTPINGTHRDLNITFIEDGVTISQMVTITILKKSAIDYHLINTNDFLVEFPNKEYVINAYLVDNRGVAVSGKDIEITTPNSRFGELSSSIEISAETTGKVSFSYTSPENIKDIDGESTTITIIFTEDGVKLTKEIKIDFIVGVEDTTLPIVVIPSDLKEIILTNNSQGIDIPIKVFKDIAPYTEGFVTIHLPKKVLDGVDVGSFESFSVPVDSDGVALLHYTGPANIKALVDSGDLNSVFEIYHSENSSKENRESLLVTYDASGDNYIPINYQLSLITENSDFSMSIPNIEKTFSVILKDLEGNVIKDSDIDISSLEVETQNALIAQIYDTNTSNLVDKFSLEKKNNSPFILKSKTLSGLVPLKIVITFEDVNGHEQTLSTILNVRVMSGLPSAISISYLSSEQDAGKAKYKERFILSVTDEYGNRVNTQPYISLGAIVGYAVDGKEVSSIESNNTHRLFYGKRDIDAGNAEGTINDLSDDNVHETEFSDNTALRSDVFQYVNREGNNSDKLIVFGRGKSYDAMGKWDISKINNKTLDLKDDYFGQTKGELYYAVGHNYYQDQCLEDGREWIGTTDSDSYQLDEEGSVVVSYKYDYQLMGKDAMIWVNLNGYQPDIGKNIRIGEAIKHTLRGRGLRSKPSNGYSLDKNTTRVATFEIWQKDTVEPYRNAHFGWNIVDGSNCQIVSVESSNSYDARTCDNGYSSEGRSYIKFLLKAPEDKVCTFNITDILVAHEF